MTVRAQSLAALMAQAEQDFPALLTAADVCVSAVMDERSPVSVAGTIIVTDFDGHRVAARTWVGQKEPEAGVTWRPWAVQD